MSQTEEAPDTTVTMSVAAPAEEPGAVAAPETTVAMSVAAPAEEPGAVAARGRKRRIDADDDDYDCALEISEAESPKRGRWAPRTGCVDECTVTIVCERETEPLGVPAGVRCVQRVDVVHDETTGSTYLCVAKFVYRYCDSEKVEKKLAKPTVRATRKKQNPATEAAEAAKQEPEEEAALPVPDNVRVLNHGTSPATYGTRYAVVSICDVTGLIAAAEASRAPQITVSRGVPLKWSSDTIEPAFNSEHFEVALSYVTIGENGLPEFRLVTAPVPVPVMRDLEEEGSDRPPPPAPADVLYREIIVAPESPDGPDMRVLIPKVDVSRKEMASRASGPPEDPDSTVRCSFTRGWNSWNSALRIDMRLPARKTAPDSISYLPCIECDDDDDDDTDSSSETSEE